MGEAPRYVDVVLFAPRRYLYTCVTCGKEQRSLCGPWLHADEELLSRYVGGKILMGESLDGKHIWVEDDQFDRLLCKKSADISAAVSDLGFSPISVEVGIKRMTKVWVLS